MAKPFFLLSTVEEFQNMVNKSADTRNKSLLPFKKKYKVQISAIDGLPLLDMKMICSPEGDIQFVIFRKRVQQLK